MSGSIKEFVRRAAGFCFILFCLIGYMFLYPKLYETVGKAATLLLLLVVIFVCEWAFEFIVSGSKRNEGR
jgi:hypothetical protein